MNNGNHLDYLLREFQERRDYLAEGLSRGNIPTIEEYRYVCGQLRGLEAATLIITDLKKRLETQDDE
jgi:hypothetical protein